MGAGLIDPAHRAGNPRQLASEVPARERGTSIPSSSVRTASMSRPRASNQDATPFKCEEPRTYRPQMGSIGLFTDLS